VDFLLRPGGRGVAFPFHEKEIMSIKKFIGDKKFYATVVGLVLPIIIQNGISNFVNLLDNIMVGRLGTEPLSGVGIANQLLFVYNLALFGGLSGAGIFTAQFFGKSDTEGMKHTFRFKLLTAAAITCMGGAVLIPFGSTLISLFLEEGDATGDAALTLSLGWQYLSVALIACLPTALTQVYSNTLRETGHTIPPMVASMVAVLTNALCNYIFIFGKLGAPALGVTGAALGTLVARLVELTVVMVWTHTHKEKAPFIVGAYRSLHIPGDLVRQIMLRGMPLLVNELLWSSGITVLNQCYSTRGLVAVAAVNMATTVANLFNIVYMSMGSAVAILVGSQLGAGNIEKAKDTDRKLIAFSCALCLGIGAVMAALSPAFTSIYQVSEQVKQMATWLIMVCAAMMPINSFAHNCYFTLRSGGQTLITFLFDSVFTWVVCVPVAMALSRLTDMPLLPLYISVTSLELLKCVVGFFLLRSGRWARKLV
jgi:putative MATE family efflux protein